MCPTDRLFEKIFTKANSKDGKFHYQHNLDQTSKWSTLQTGPQTMDVYTRLPGRKPGLPGKEIKFKNRRLATPFPVLASYNVPSSSMTAVDQCLVS